MSTTIRAVVITCREPFDGHGEEFWFPALDGDGFDLSQHYDLFCALAGVRCGNRPPPQFAHRGLPPFCPDFLISEFVGCEGVTWLRPEEFLPVIDYAWKDEYDGGWRCFAECLRDLTDHMGSERVRVVLGFL